MLKKALLGILVGKNRYFLYSKIPFNTPKSVNESPITVDLYKNTLYFSKKLPIKIK